VCEENTRASKDDRVTYEAFGAAGDGVTDDLPAICAAHEHANANGLPVKTRPDATYHLGGRALTAVIATDSDWRTSRQGATANLSSRDTPSSLGHSESGSPAGVHFWRHSQPPGRRAGREQPGYVGDVSRDERVRLEQFLEHLCCVLYDDL
jgi:hypothetical protein